MQSYTATVKNVKDPKKRGRIEVACAALLGDEESKLPMWLEPCFQWGFFVIPDVGDVVEIVGDMDGSTDEIVGQTSIENPNLRWMGWKWQPEIPEQMKKHYGKRRGIFTPAGHLLIFDDTKGSCEVLLSCKGTAALGASFLSLSDDGSVNLAAGDGAFIYMNAKLGQNSFVDRHGNAISTGPTGAQIITKDGNFIDMGAAAIQVVAQGNVVIQGGSVSLLAGSVAVGNGASEHFVKGESLMTWLNTHTHTSAAPGVATSPPITPADPLTILSTNNQVA